MDSARHVIQDNLGLLWLSILVTALALLRNSLDQHIFEGELDLLLCRSMEHDLVGVLSSRTGAIRVLAGLKLLGRR